MPARLHNGYNEVPKPYRCVIVTLQNGNVGELKLITATSLNSFVDTRHVLQVYHMQLVKLYDTYIKNIILKLNMLSGDLKNLLTIFLFYFFIFFYQFLGLFVFVLQISQF